MGSGVATSMTWLGKAAARLASAASRASAESGLRLTRRPDAGAPEWGGRAFSEMVEVVAMMCWVVLDVEC
jgi:hypothetical protein